MKKVVHNHQNVDYIQKISNSNTTQNTSNAKELKVKRMKITLNMIKKLINDEFFDQNLLFLPVQNLLQLA